ncbi:MAG TPA: hypothetical protein VG013_02345 [Gemmataceae bacterium]|jgi:hypothetical protein|nr:hypothetical protein [Gemmataceae bacterium]
MLETTTQVFDIQTIGTIQPYNGALVVAFGSGLVARLPPDHPDRDRMLREAVNSLQQRRALGLMVNGDGQILELSYAHDTTVRSIKEDEEDKSRLAGWFWEYSPVCYLTREHAEFDRIRATLEEAVASGSRVWLANRMHLVDSETEIWWKILDVRAVRSLTS